MKANAPKRKVFQDALDLLAEDPVKNTPVPVNGIVSIPVEEIHPFHDHPFRLYEGERLEDMVQSIREYGVLNPVIVRKAARGYEDVKKSKEAGMDEHLSKPVDIAALEQTVKRFRVIPPTINSGLARFRR